MQASDEDFLRKTIALAYQSYQRGADPFGALLVSDNHIAYQSEDHCVDYSDPTAHAELCVISEYCRNHKQFRLNGYTLYASTEPCEMCAGAIHWARISRVVFSVSLSTLQQLSGGKPRIDCRSILLSGSRSVEIIGPLLEKEGITVFKDHTFNTKVARHQALFPPDSP